jgi:hypothetical protein
MTAATYRSTSGTGAPAWTPSSTSPASGPAPATTSPPTTQSSTRSVPSPSNFGSSVPSPAAPGTSRTPGSSSTPSGSSKTDNPETHLWACECPPCTNRRNRYKKNWWIARHRGQPSTLVDSAPTLDYIRNALLPAAWTRAQIGYAAGLDPCYIARLLGEQGPDSPPHIRVETAQAILALRYTARFRNVPDRALVNATGTHRRLQALGAKGHQIEKLLKEMRCSNGVMAVEFVTAGNARRIAEAYDRLWCVHGPSKIGAVRARNRGWVGPGAWDDATIDDPRAVPRVGEAPRVWTLTELLAEAKIAEFSGTDARVVAQRVGTTVASLARARERARERSRNGGQGAAL